MIRLIYGSSPEALCALDDNSVDSIVTDPPYGLSFMGKKWDYDVPSVDVWRECLRVLKPGGHLLAFAGTRTQHRMAVRIEDAGFEIRDMIAWVYGSGFPKSLDVSKAMDKRRPDGSAPATDAARQWQGWGTALKPALEPITVARKPLVGTVAENVLTHGTGALNIDGCRVGDNAGWSYPNGRGGTAWHGRDSLANNLTEPMAATQGRWPANLLHDGGEEVTGLLGEAARFFYTPKASRSDREDGCGHLEAKSAGEVTGGREEGSPGIQSPRAGAGRCRDETRNFHPTVKPTDLMRYLCRLVTPPGGVILDPFMGSGSTGRGAVLEGFRFIGVEREADYLEIARARINAVAPKPDRPRPITSTGQLALF